MVKLVGEGSVINVSTPSSLLTESLNKSSSFKIYVFNSFDS